jgi:hypothetical protein
MLVIRAYTVLDLLMVEVTCAGHGDGEQGAHMVYRAATRPLSLELHDVLQECSMALFEAYHYVEQGEGGATDDCALC